MLHITQRRQDGTLIAVYTGELDHHAARAAIEQTEDLLVLFPCEKLVLDPVSYTHLIDAQLGQTLRDQLCIGIHDVAQQDLCADCDKFCVQ